MRRFEFTDRGKELYGLPYGLEGDMEDPRKKAPHPSRSIRNGILGYNAARAYRFDPHRRRHAIHCDDVQRLKDEGYISSHGTETETAPLRTNQAPGARTRREVVKNLEKGPWSP